MPNKKKFGKNIKLKRKMKGGALGDIDEPLTPNKDGAAVVEATDVMPVAKATEAPKAKAVAIATPVGKSKQSGSSYAKYSDNVYISVVMGIGLMGAIWFIISRTLITHKYSEVLSYSLMGFAVTMSLLLIIFKDSSTSLW